MIVSGVEMVKTPFLFVSHVQEDSTAASKIADDLEQRGVACWIAPRDAHLQVGRTITEIAAALLNCSAMLLVFSDRCNENDYIRRKVTVAGQNGKIIIVFRLEDTKPRNALQQRLSDLNWVDGFVCFRESDR